MYCLFCLLLFLTTKNVCLDIRGECLGAISKCVLECFDHAVFGCLKLYMRVYVIMDFMNI